MESENEIQNGEKQKIDKTTVSVLIQLIQEIITMTNRFHSDFHSAVLHVIVSFIRYMIFSLFNLRLLSTHSRKNLFLHWFLLHADRNFQSLFFHCFHNNYLLFEMLSVIIIREKKKSNCCCSIFQWKPDLMCFRVEIEFSGWVHLLA